MDPAVKSIAKKLRARKVKIATIVNRCETLDGNQDGVIHIDDLESVLIEFLGIDGVSKREIANLGRLLAQNKRGFDGSTLYHKLYHLFDPPEDQLGEKVEKRRAAHAEEEWFDPDDAMPYLDSKQGSIGEWLNYSACPAEVRNFKRFIQCLEEYERISGMKCTTTEKGIEIPMGPDLKAQLSFVMK